MRYTSPHSFHIPVMGLAYTIDTPLKVARFGIDSVLSIIDANLIEAMRKFHSQQLGVDYTPIGEKDYDARARMITAYLNFLDAQVKAQMEQLKSESFETNSEINQYFEMLPEGSPLRLDYERMKGLAHGEERWNIEHRLRKNMVAGSIDVNIMTKVDKPNYDAAGESLGPEFSDAKSALRGFANSVLSSSVVFSAGLNPYLYSYCEVFPDFFPDEEGKLKKKIILKVSDYRSAMIQGKFLAKKGLWISEFRIESGLNCGGHAFATEGHLLAPILEEFKIMREELSDELLGICNAALVEKGKVIFAHKPKVKLTVQGGIGTANENAFLLDYFEVDSTGWGSPFLLVPEVSNVDDETLQNLATAQPDDYFVSDASPLGVLFNNFRKSSGDADRRERIKKGRPGSPCYNKNLAFNTEYSPQGLCTASREYQDLKIKEIEKQDLAIAERDALINKVTEKECICQGLGTSVFLKNHLPAPHKIKSVSICPGPNLAYFSGVYSLREMVDHIYGRKNLLNGLSRPNMFLNELNLYVAHLEKEIAKYKEALSVKTSRYLNSFKENLQAGLAYYKALPSKMKMETSSYRLQFLDLLDRIEMGLQGIKIPEGN